MKKSTLSLARISRKIFALLSVFLLSYSFSSAQYSPMPGTPRPGDGMGWLDNGTVKIAVDLNYGGAVTYFSRSNTNVNTVNNSDHGRQMQWAMYSGPDDFSQNGPDPMWRTLGWNPIEAGDCKNNAPTVLTYANDGTTIYTKLQPYHWPILTTLAECYFEKWITLDGNAAKVHFRFTSFRSDQTVYYERRQELPCLYTQPQYSRHVFYEGDNPWVNAPVTTSTNPAFLLNHVSEGWMAAEEPSTGDAVGIWSKHYFDYARLIVGDASYMAVEPKIKFYPGKVEDWDAAIIAGSVSQIRSWVYAQSRPPTRPDFHFNGTRNEFNTYDMVEAGTPTTQWELTVPNVSDWNINSQSLFFKATDVPKLYITAAFNLSNVTSMGIGWNRYGQGSGNILQLNQYQTFPIINDGQYHTYEVDMSTHPNWISGIQQILLIRNPSIVGATSGTVKLRSISYQSGGCTTPSAPSISVSGGTSTTCPDGSRTVTLTASGCSGGTITWSNGATGSSINVTAPGTYTATCTSGGCSSSNSNAITVSNGSGCPGCTAPSAPAISITSGTTTTCSDGSRTVTISATGCSGGTINWSNGGTGSSINVTAAGTYTATCTVSGCVSSNSNGVTVSNGGDCSGGGVNPPGNYGGSLDGANCDYINGWAWNGSNHRVVLEVVDGSNGDAVITEIVANTYRNDLQAAGIGDGVHSFWISTPSALKNGQNHNVKVRVKGINFTLANSPITVNCAGGGCTPPAAPSLSASPTTVNSGSSSTLTASGCSGGTITWSNSLGTGTSKSVSPTSTTTYTATCTIDGCTSGNGSVTVNVNVNGGPFSQCLESESSSGDGSVTSDPNASNGQTRGDENNYNKYVDYVVTGVPSGGTYFAKLRYSAANDPIVSVQVNGGTAQSVTLARTATWNIVFTEQTISVALAAGTNTIRIQGTGGGSCRQDRLCVTNNSGGSLMLEDITGEVANTELRIFPNPVNNSVNISYFLNKDGEVSVKFLDVLGRVKQVRKLQGKAGNNQSNIQLNTGITGIFFVETIIEGKRKVKTLMKK